jgi:hypothetical protein
VTALLTAQHSGATGPPLALAVGLTDGVGDVLVTGVTVGCGVVVGTGVVDGLMVPVGEGDGLAQRWTAAVSSATTARADVKLSTSMLPLTLSW